MFQCRTATWVYVSSVVTRFGCKFQFQTAIRLYVSVSHPQPDVYLFVGQNGTPTNAHTRYVVIRIRSCKGSRWLRSVCKQSLLLLKLSVHAFADLLFRCWQNRRISNVIAESKTHDVSAECVFDFLICLCHYESKTYSVCCQNSVMSWHHDHPPFVL